MILSELYSIRKFVTEAAHENDDVKEAKKQIDSLIQLISNAPQANSNANFPRPKLR
jgi:hypothetical protein